MQRTRQLPAPHLRLAALAVSLVLVGCASAPVQEMSDARQAIQAAADAGAEEAAPEALQDARLLLDRAQKKLARQAYNSARTDAKEARRRAAEALEAARAQEDP